MGRTRPGRAMGLLAFLTIGSGLLTGTAVPAGALDQLGSDELPVAGTSSYHSRQDDTAGEVRGVVHAVRRVPGGTAVYYSVGSPAGQRWDRSGWVPPPSLKDDYRAGDADSVALVDTQALQYYQPMVGPEGCLCPRLRDFGRDSGVLHVGWAVTPPLPPQVDTVSVSFGFGNVVEDVPVGEGPLEPAVRQGSTVLGEGWPALPDDAAVASVTDPGRYVRALVRSIADLEQVVSTREQPGEVAESLSADVLFATGSATLTPAARGTLEEVGGRLRERAVGEVTITGHADSTGSPAINLPLSQSRAQAVRDALQPLVAPDTVLTPEGVGDREPVADNATAEGRQQNRRVTVSYAVGEGG